MKNKYIENSKHWYWPIDFRKQFYVVMTRINGITEIKYFRDEKYRYETKLSDRNLVDYRPFLPLAKP